MNAPTALPIAAAPLTRQQQLTRRLATLGPDLRLAATAAVLTGGSYLTARIARTQSAPWWHWARDTLIVLSWDMAFFSLLVLCLGRLHRGLRAQGAARWAALAGLATLIGALALALFQRFHGLRMNGWVMPVQYLPWIALTNLFYGVLLVTVFEFRHSNRIAAAALDTAALQDLTAQGAWDQARAQLLQAQIEPHFLFNALANVRRLLRTEPAAARRMLGDLSRYLQQALPSLREPETTLQREASLVQAYLAVHRVRMGPRLQAALDIPPALQASLLPPMLLLTLVENAIKHGLAPLPEGGCITVTARATTDVLTLSVADDGAGMAQTSGHGLGLANTRARLRAAYGSAATLSLSRNEPRGVVAILRLPLRLGTDAGTDAGTAIGPAMEARAPPQPGGG
ncbi:MAG: histidine kinase [Burkholderiales bacterium]|nr:histidine kinase [Burkholderiales bacterium]